MDNLYNLNTLNGLNHLVKNSEVKGFNWKGEKVLSYDGNKTLPLTTLIHKLSQAFKAECFKGSHLSEHDCKTLNEIKDKITKLDSVPIQIGRFEACYLFIIGIAKWILFLDNENQKNALMEAIENKASKPSEALLLEKTGKGKLFDNVKKALNYAYEYYYKKPYKDTHIRRFEASRVAQGEQIHRYNHGFAHTIRKVFFIPFIIDYLLRHSPDNLSNSLQELIKKDGLENVTQKLQIAIMFEVAGRESECGSRDNLETYTGYLTASAKAFKDYCTENHLVGEGNLFKDTKEVEKYAQAITQKYHNRSNENMDVITAILDIAHTLDEFRCYWPSRMQVELEGINNYYTKDKNNRDLWQLAKFCETAVKVTGDRLMAELSEGFEQRSRAFAIGDWTSKLFRNFTFTNGLAFANCSKDLNYCWDLLNRISPPISYSQGETTFSYLQKTVEPTQNPDQAANVLQMIKDGNAAIRLVNTQAEKFGFEMEMINNPVFFRPTRATNGGRDWALSNRNAGIVHQRGFKERRSLQDQMHRKAQKDAKQAVHKDSERGLPKLTEHTKKLSLTLLRPDAKIKHFAGEFPREYGRYEPVGFLYDVRQLHQKGQKYVFDKDVGTSSKFWIGPQAMHNTSKKEGRETNLSLDDLKAKLKTESDQKEDATLPAFYKMQHAANEILMCPKKQAIKAVFATEDTPQARVRTFIHAIYLAQDYGIRVPMLIIDGEKEPTAYSSEQLNADLEALSNNSNSANKKIIQSLTSCFFSKADVSNKPTLADLAEKCSHFFV